MFRVLRMNLRYENKLYLIKQRILVQTNSYNLGVFFCLFVFSFSNKAFKYSFKYLHLGSHCVEVCTHTHTHTHTHTRASLVAQLVKKCVHTHTHTGFPCGLAGKESNCSTGDLVSIPGLGRSPGNGKSNPLQHFCLQNSMGCIVCEVAKSQTQLSDFHKGN